MNLKQMTEKAQEALLAAQELAQETGHPQIEPEHLLVTLVDQDDGIVPNVIQKMGINPRHVLDAARAELGRLPETTGGEVPNLSPRLSDLGVRAKVDAEHLKDEFISTEHLLVAITFEEGRSPAAKLLGTRDHSRADLRGTHIDPLFSAGD